MIASPGLWTPRPRRSRRVECAPLGWGLAFGRPPKILNNSWAPTTPAGLVLWLRADLGVTIGTGVSAWADQSPTGASFTQSTGSAQPTVNNSSINGQKGLTFASGSSQTLAAAHNAAWNLAAFTMVLVMKPTSAFAGFEAPLNKASSGAWADGYGFYFNAGASLFGWTGNFSGGALNFGTFTLATPYVVVYEWDGTNATARVNGSVIGSGVAGTQVNNTAALNVGFGPGGTYFNGDIDEIIIWNNKIAAGDLTSLGAYTTNRYAIGA